MNTSAQGRHNRNARGIATARAIERAAVELAALHGADSVTVDEICAAVGVSQRTFFNHFDTKEDALLGLELPRINEQRTREYLADSEIGILTGALGLIELPSEHEDEPQLTMARFAVLASSPALGRRQAARLTPIAGEVEKIIYLKLRAENSAMDSASLRSAAHTIASMAASLLMQLGDDITAGKPSTAAAPAARLRELSRIWSRML
ncbi:MAG: helix-turn-helix domain-containing protein [Actinomycetota bacterium]